jgi:hypothetical protein
MDGRHGGIEGNIEGVVPRLSKRDDLQLTCVGEEKVLLFLKAVLNPDN